MRQKRVVSSTDSKQITLCPQMTRVPWRNTRNSGSVTMYRWWSPLTWWRASTLVRTPLSWLLETLRFKSPTLFTPSRFENKYSAFPPSSGWYRQVICSTNFFYKVLWLHLSCNNVKKWTTVSCHGIMGNELKLL